MYTLKVLIGTRIDLVDLYTEKKERGCEHDLIPYNDSGGPIEFCARCGKPIWIFTKEPIEGYLLKESTYYGFDVLVQHNMAYIGILMVDSPSGIVEGRLQHRSIPSENFKERLKEVLGKKFWEGNYGMYTFTLTS